MTRDCDIEPLPVTLLAYNDQRELTEHSIDVLPPHDVAHLFFEKAPARFNAMFIGDQDPSEYWHAVQNLPWMIDHPFRAAILEAIGPFAFDFVESFFQSIQLVPS